MYHSELLSYKRVGCVTVRSLQHRDQGELVSFFIYVVLLLICFFKYKRKYFKNCKRFFFVVFFPSELPPPPSPHLFMDSDWINNIIQGLFSVVFVFLKSILKSCLAGLLRGDGFSNTLT